MRINRGTSDGRWLFFGGRGGSVREVGNCPAGEVVEDGDGGLPRRPGIFESIESKSIVLFFGDKSGCAGWAWAWGVAGCAAPKRGRSRDKLDQWKHRSRWPAHARAHKLRPEIGKAIVHGHPLSLSTLRTRSF